MTFSRHLAVRLTILLLFCHVLGQPLLGTAQLVVPFNLQKLHLLFTPVSFTLEPHELKCIKKILMRQFYLQLNEEELDRKKKYRKDMAIFLPLHHQTWQTVQAPQLQPVHCWDLGNMIHYNIPEEENNTMNIGNVMLP